MRYFLRCSFLLLSASCIAAPGVAEFERVNQLRSQAGLPMLMQDQRLVQAAAMHAAYLDRHRDPAHSGQGLSSHTQLPGDLGFSGEGRLTEAVYADSGSYYEICEDARRVRAEWLEAHCAALPARAAYTDSGRYRLPCAAATRVRVEHLDSLDAVRRQSAPEVVLWPPPGAANIPPAFFLEQPDPLPDLPLSGYPLSIQFNPQHAQLVTLEAFDLFLREGEAFTRVEDVRLLDRDSDPNQVLSDYEFVLFPLERLGWGQQYLARAAALVDGVRRQFEWTFTTQGVGTPILTATAAQQRFSVRSGVEYLLYLPPQAQRPHTVLTTRTEHLRDNKVILDAVDPNTLRLRVEARRCDRVRLLFDGGRVVELVPDGCAG